MRKKTTASLKKQAWKLLSLIVRQGTADHRGNAICYTCGVSQPWKQQQAGHAIGGRHGAVLFDEELLRVQCVGCNVFRRGNYQIFITKLIRENGLDWWERKLADSRRERKFTRGELLEMIEIYKSRLSVIERFKKWTGQKYEVRQGEHG